MYDSSLNWRFTWKYLVYIIKSGKEINNPGSSWEPLAGTVTYPASRYCYLLGTSALLSYSLVSTCFRYFRKQTVNVPVWKAFVFLQILK